MKKTHRRLGTGIIWAVINLCLIYLQPTMQLSEKIVLLFVEKSTWIAGLLIVGWSGTNAVMSYVNGKKKEIKND